MEKFWSLVKESVILQGAVTLLLVGVASYLWARGEEVPQELIQLLQLVVGFWLGSKAQHLVEKSK